MKTPKHIRIGQRTYTVSLSKREGTKTAYAPEGYVYIFCSDWATSTPSPFRWPPIAYDVTWEGSTALLTSKIQPSR
ncbi:hypothetical protein LEM8419_03587 [Neolewinella maritima]|uniref:Uncharacterized protein n=1 Tax=Neolewinella maritima TaxID=1383882 RepID=A0ABM9B5Q4_9BACT|nr:hypothetical protein LEM8419_03587 [Neolewinella maritima]